MGEWIKGQDGKKHKNEILDKCPNPRCTKPRLLHTNEQAKECLRTASSDA